MAEDQQAEDGTTLTRLQLYKREIELYEKESKKWEERGKKIIRRYRDDRGNSEYVQKVRYNILYSNVQTLMPAIYARNPKPDIQRRFKDDDVLGRVASDVLERATSYFVTTEKFGSVMRQALLDRLLPGRGIAWARYIPHFRDAALQGNTEVAEEGSQISDDLIAGDAAEKEDPLQEVYYEEAVADYVHWQDFGHNVARTWEEVYLGWRKVYLTKEEGQERFGEVFNKIPLDYHPEKPNDSPAEQVLAKATVYELWDKNRKKVTWLNKDMEEPLDEQDDPLKLKDFFPFPPPLLAVTANDSLIPTPDYVEYQDQAGELDEITARISAITRCIKAVGAYDASAPALERLLAEGNENSLIPVESWTTFAGKGGIEGGISFLPIEQYAKALLALYEAREHVKNDLYEITGIADIIRGSTEANETATAQKMKGQFATLRLSDEQRQMQEFVRDMVVNIATIIAQHFSMDTIKKISGVKLLTAQEKQMFQQQMQLAQSQGMQPPPLDDKQQELLNNPTWEEIEQLFRNEPALCFRIDIETDSIIKMDEEADKQARVEFLTAASQYIGQVLANPAVPKEFMPLLGEMLLFGIRGFKVGKQIEGQFRVALDKLEKVAKAPPQAPPPDPKLMQIQATAQANKEKTIMESQAREKEIAMEAQAREKEIVLDHQRDTAQMQNEVTMETQKMIIGAKVDIQKAEIAAEAKAKQPQNS